MKYDNSLSIHLIRNAWKWYLEILTARKADSAPLEVDHGSPGPLVHPGPVVDGGVAVVAAGQGVGDQGHALQSWTVQHVRVWSSISIIHTVQENIVHCDE